MLRLEVHDPNAILIGLDEEEPKPLLCLSKSFASGQVFSTSILDAFVSMVTDVIISLPYYLNF